MPKILVPLYDKNGNELLRFESITAAVNELTIVNAATSGAIELKATGNDTNINVKITPKGTGKISLPNETVSWIGLSNGTMNLNQAAPANDTDITVPSNVRRRFVFGNVFVRPTALVSGLIEIKITPSGGVLTSVGSCYADPAADTQSNGLWYAFEVRAGDKYRFTRSGAAGVTENIQAYNYIDYL